MYFLIYLPSHQRFIGLNILPTIGYKSHIIVRFLRSICSIVNGVIDGAVGRGISYLHLPRILIIVYMFCGEHKVMYVAWRYSDIWKVKFYPAQIFCNDLLSRYAY
ncbi:hypothetical protein AYK25_07140 [Thermoplasmatales archaeon SM1-50]|nr:MAG: hypothetical protein AYK25_07140 [Thermoplasmatales archaeon SM1-50]